jgi:hypothetical protein
VPAMTVPGHHNHPRHPVRSTQLLAPRNDVPPRQARDAPRIPMSRCPAAAVPARRPQ